MPNTQESATRAQSPRLEVTYTRPDGSTVMKAIQDGKVFEQAQWPPGPQGVSLRFVRKPLHNLNDADAELLATCLAHVDALAVELGLSGERRPD